SCMASCANQFARDRAPALLCEAFLQGVRTLRDTSSATGEEATRASATGEEATRASATGEEATRAAPMSQSTFPQASGTRLRCARAHQAPALHECPLAPARFCAPPCILRGCPSSAFDTYHLHLGSN